MMPMKTSLTTSTVTSRDPKGLKFMQNCEAAYNKAGLNENRAQCLNENPEFTKGLAVLIGKCSQTDNRFELTGIFEITVPEGYDHATRLTAFGKEHRKEFYYYNDAITDTNYANATTKLVPGRRFLVRVFQIKERVSSDDCLGLLKSQKAVLVGAQGASLAYEQDKDKLPVNRWSVSFDEKKALWTDAGGYRRVPCVYRLSGGAFEFRLGSVEDGWNDGHCLLCFCDLEPESSVA
jgi:hypothetical protein